MVEVVSCGVKTKKILINLWSTLGGTLERNVSLSFSQDDLLISWTNVAVHLDLGLGAQTNWISFIINITNAGEVFYNIAFLLDVQHMKI